MKGLTVFLIGTIFILNVKHMTNHLFPPGCGLWPRAEVVEELSKVKPGVKGVTALNQPAHRTNLHQLFHGLIYQLAGFTASDTVKTKEKKIIS